MKLRLARHSLGDAVVVAVAGELDLFTAPVLRDEVRDAIKQDGARLVLDLQQLSFMDSSGLSVLIEAWRLATGEGGGVSLAAPQAPVARILRTTGLDRRIKVYSDVDSAVGEFDPTPSRTSFGWGLGSVLWT
ncbi:STAS domain-containing protein [Nonomuraea ferruginea]